MGAAAAGSAARSTTRVRGDGSAHVRLPYLPALDGLRGAALIAILLLHGGVPGVPGGHLALTAFFTLSGFLITALLLVERHRTGTVDLRLFWTRRARRLVPALLLTFPLVAVVVLLAEVPPASSLLLDAVAAALWVANWRFVLSDQQYADLFALPSPFQHFWSLAVEEQFYLVFPLVLLGVLGVRAARPRTGRLALLLGVLVVASTVQVVRLHAAGGELGRAYYGTDARLAEILVGALLALAMVGPQGLRPLAPHVRRAVGAAGVVGLLGLGVLVLTLAKDDPLTYRGGFLLAALLTAAVVAAGTQPRSLVTRALSVRPLVRLGVLSYAVYLFHWPLFLLLTERWTGIGGPALLALRLGTVVGLAWLSFVLLERPVRTGDLPALPALGSWATGAVAGVVVVAAASTAVTLTPPVLVQQAAPAGAATPLDAAGPPREVLLAQQPGSPADVGATGPADQQVSAQTQQAPSPAAAAPSASPTPTRAAAPTSVPRKFLAPPEKVVVPPPPPPPPTQEPGAPPPPAPPVRVAVVGDSIAGDLGKALERWSSGRTDVVALSFAVGGCPISRGGDRRVVPDRHFPIIEECDWWARDSQRRRDFQSFAPDIVLVEAGIDEVFERRLEGWDDWRKAGDPRFDTWLLGEYQAAVDQFSSRGASVLLLNAPCADWSRVPSFAELAEDDEGDRRARAVNRGAYSLVRRVQSVDLAGRICPGGRYLHDVEGEPDGRFDGVHFTDRAADKLAVNWLGPIVLEAAARR